MGGHATIRIFYLFWQRCPTLTAKNSLFLRSTMDGGSSQIKVSASFARQVGCHVKINYSGSTPQKLAIPSDKNYALQSYGGQRSLGRSFGTRQFCINRSVTLKQCRVLRL